MSVRYRLNYWEAIRGQWLLQAHYLRVSPFTNYPLLGLVAVIFILAPLGLALWVLFEQPGADGGIALLGAGPFILLVIFLTAGVGMAALFRFSCLLEIDPEGVEVSSFLRHVRRPWSAMVRLETDNQYLYFGSETSEGALFLMVPMRFFESDEQARAFFDQAAAYRKQATGEPDEIAAQPAGAWPPAPKGAEQDLP